MTLQEIFNVAYLGLMKQGKPSRELKGCYYRLEDRDNPGKNLCCGVGFLIKDEFYNVAGETGVYEILPRLRMNQYDVAEATLFKMLFESGVDCSDNLVHDLLCDIQSAHDSIIELHRFKENLSIRFTDIAAKFGLDMPEVPA